MRGGMMAEKVWVVDVTTWELRLMHRGYRAKSCNFAR
jgi:hypothetical protein